MKNKSILYLAALGFALVLPIACGGPSQDPAAKLASLKEQKAQLETEIAALEKEVGGPTAAPRTRTVGLTELKAEPFRHFVDMQGRVDAENIVMATSKMPGSLTRILVKNGSNVSKGQLLAEMDDELMQKGLAQLETQLAFAKDVYNRQKGLWDQKIGTEIQFLQAKNAVENIEKQIASTKEQWGQSKIYAPIGGTVDNVFLKVGQSIAPGVPLCQIVNLGDMKIKGEVPDAYVAKVKQGDPVVVFFPDMNKEITSRVTYISKTINPVNRTFSIECALPNGAAYKPNQVAVMKIVDYSKASAIIVPVNVLQSGDGGDFVLVADKTGDKVATVRKAPVKQGQNYNGMVEITDGLKKGEWLITTGFQDVNAGETVSF